MFVLSAPNEAQQPQLMKAPRRVGTCRGVARRLRLCSLESALDGRINETGMEMGQQGAAKVDSRRMQHL